MHPVNNEQVFEITVRELLHQYGVPVVDQGLPSLLEAIEDGEGNTDSALNLIVQAYVGHLMSDVTMPFGKDPWAENLLAMKPAIQRGLQKSYLLLSQTTPSVYPVTHSGRWVSFIETCYRLPDWSNLGGHYFNAFFNLQVAVSNLAQIGLVGASLLTENGLKQGDILAPVAKAILDLANGERVTTWHRFLSAEVIQRFIVAAEELPFDTWRNLIDLCGSFIDRSDYSGHGVMLASAHWEDGPPRDTTDVKYLEVPTTSKEFWAWQFGRVAALGNKLDKPKLFDRFDDFQDWPEGVVALSLLMSSGKPVEWDERWLGAIASCDNPDLEERNPLPVTSGLYWLMHIGVLNAVRRVEQRDHQPETKEAVPAASGQALLIGSPEELGKSIVEAVELAEQLRLQKTTDELKQRLSPVWGTLPPDAQEHLIQAELHLKKRDFKNASLDYANSVEAALLDWLPKPKGVPWWPQTLGDLSSLAKRMTAPNPQVDRGIQDFKRRFDVKYATELSNALEVFQTGRLSRAHSGERLPSAHKARKTALGIDQQNIFELLLRFAKRWRG